MSRLPFLLAAGVLIGLDRLTKWWASGTLEYGAPEALLGDVIRLTRVHNEGGAFGIFPGGGAVFVVVSSVVAALLLFLLMAVRIDSRWMRAGMTLVFAGAAGNLVDRLLWGHVLDFFEIRGFPVFNVADACITVGAVLILVAVLWGGERHRSRRTTDRV